MTVAKKYHKTVLRIEQDSSMWQGIEFGDKSRHLKKGSLLYYDEKRNGEQVIIPSGLLFTMEDERSGQGIPGVASNLQIASKRIKPSNFSPERRRE